MDSQVSMPSAPSSLARPSVGAPESLMAKKRRLKGQGVQESSIVAQDSVSTDEVARDKGVGRGADWDPEGKHEKSYKHQQRAAARKAKQAREEELKGIMCELDRLKKRTLQYVR